MADREGATSPLHVSGLFGAPPWLRDLGMASWLGVGVTLMIVGTIWVLSLTETIVMPVTTAAIIAAVTSPLVRGLQNHGMSRGIASALVLLAIVALAVVVIIAILT